MLAARTSARRAAAHRAAQRSQRAVARLPALFLLANSYHDTHEYGCHSPPAPKPGPYEGGAAQANASLLLLANAYRRYGHLSSNLDPLGLRKQEHVEELAAGTYGLTEDSAEFSTKGIVAPATGLPPTASLREIIAALQSIYCEKISYEFEHIESLAVRRWFSDYVESLKQQALPERSRRHHELLVKSEGIEQFLQKKLPSTKRYGLEGSESVVVLLDQLMYEGAQHGLADVVASLSHRGRINILTTLFGYPLDVAMRKIRGGSEFPDKSPHTGDMLVDLSGISTLSIPDVDMPIEVEIAANACHLETGTPVGMGKSRARDIGIARAKSNDRHAIGDHVLPISVHGDSGFSGQGIVAESLGMSGLAHFNNGGTIHVVLNNQIGYTTPASHTRTTRYASDIAKFANVPVIHVNGEDPEDAARAARIAVAYRQEFRRDVVIDLWTFRKRGHNELDEPSFTQPAMYRTIAARPSIPAAYEERLIAAGKLTRDEAEAVRCQWARALDAAFEGSASCSPAEPRRPHAWSLLGAPGDRPTEGATGVDVDTLFDIGVQSVAAGEGLRVHPRIERFHIRPRLKRLEEGRGIDWATAEALAFGSLLREGHGVRLCGQDVGRGTFSQRHAMFVCQDTERVYVPLNHMAPGDGARRPGARPQGKLEVVNSNLCEEAVVGFEYGMATEDPFTLPIWEAQFGDFFNNSQTLIDAYVASGETKWGRQNGLVLLLPHGFDGGGPDHSSSRIERHLQLSNDPASGHAQTMPNIHVAYPTTPAQFFHLLRRQQKRNFRRPLIVAGPKTLLRLASATSSLSEMGPGTRFQPVLDDPTIHDPLAVKRVMLVSGKAYYDLEKTRSEHPLGAHVAIVRIEELAPFPRGELYSVLEQYANATDFVWVQEEPRNAGAYAFAAPRIQQQLPPHAELRYVGRPEHAAVCSGVDAHQAAEQAQLVQNAFEGLRGLVADLVIGSISIQKPAPSPSHQHKQQHQQQKPDKPIPAALHPASVSHRWAAGRSIYAATQPGDR
ncbi:hypothetical protein H4R18_004913 [Coemansia javaensis]|uniref:Transketolase-like pyrimidine-binding domain-containing protein n=1 Tax=Coemansia javaensis TaxID=2761396 RepID=A0A9W8HA99_9FUNG|nr:hypothetical protein H4R18_004913 [Coemansia javaensis]